LRACELQEELDFSGVLNPFFQQPGVVLVVRHQVTDHPRGHIRLMIERAQEVVGGNTL
jgi:hypothetical protein